MRDAEDDWLKRLVCAFARGVWTSVPSFAHLSQTFMGFAPSIWTSFACLVIGAPHNSQYSVCMAISVYISVSDYINSFHRRPWDVFIVGCVSVGLIVSAKKCSCIHSLSIHSLIRSLSLLSLTLHTRIRRRTHRAFRCIPRQGSLFYRHIHRLSRRLFLRNQIRPECLFQGVQ